MSRTKVVNLLSMIYKERKFEWWINKSSNPLTVFSAQYTVHLKKYTRGSRFVYHYGFYLLIPDSKIHSAHMGPIWGRQEPGGPHVGPMNVAIWDLQNPSWLLHWIGSVPVNELAGAPFTNTELL